MTLQSATDPNYLATIQKLLADYLRQFPHDAERLSVLRQQIERNEAQLCDRKTLPGHLTGSAIVWQSKTRSILLIYHNSLKRWLQPGGHLDLLEHPEKGARRELDEEVGKLPVTLHEWHAESGIPIDIDSHVIPPSEKKQEQQHFHHDFLYVFTLSADDDSLFQLQQEEVLGYKWVSLDEISNGQFEDRLKRVSERLSFWCRQ